MATNVETEDTFVEIQETQIQKTTNPSLGKERPQGLLDDTLIFDGQQMGGFKMTSWHQDDLQRRALLGPRLDGRVPRWPDGTVSP